MVRDEQVQALDELVAVGVVKARVALLAVIDQHLAARVRENRRTDRERLKSQQRPALVRRRHDDDGRRFERLQALLIRQAAREPDEALLGERHQLDAHQHERRVPSLLHIRAEILDQLFTAFAGVYPPAIQDERSVQAVTAPEDDASPREMGTPAWRPILLLHGL